MSAQNWFPFGPCWPNFGPLVAAKWLKMVFSDHHLKKYSCNPIQTWSVYLLGECSEWISFGPFWPSSVHKMIEKSGFRTLHYLKDYSCNSIQTWCVHPLCECSESIHFWAMLAKFWPSSGRRMTDNGGFRPLSEKVFMQSNSNLVWIFKWMIVQNWLAFGTGWPNFGPLVATKWIKIGGFWLLSEKVFTQYNSNLVSTFVGRVFTNDSFWASWPN